MTLDYCCEDDDTAYSSEDEAVERYLDDRDPARWPRRVRVDAYRLASVSDADRRACVERALDSVLEILEPYCWYEDYKAPPEMRAAAETFVAAVVAQYPMRVYDDPKPASSSTVETAAWVREVAPRWLEDDEVQRALARLEDKDT